MAIWWRRRKAQRLAMQHPHAFFLTPGGECFHNATVTGGKPASEGPLALKRELRETEMQAGASWNGTWRRRRLEAATLTRHD